MSAFPGWEGVPQSIVSPQAQDSLRVRRGVEGDPSKLDEKGKPIVNIVKK